MIIIVGEFKVKPEHREEAVQASLRMAQASQAEPGCIAYQFYADLQAPDTLFLFETWETEEALTAHGQTEHMAEFRQHLPKLLADAVTLKRYQAEPAERA